MARNNPLRDPWLIAVWPGMGSVALVAASYLLQTLRARKVHEMDTAGLFEVQHVEVREGLASMGRLPRSMFFEWRDPNKKHDLVIFVGEAQPPVGGTAMCEQVLNYAAQRGVTRLFTFAAMATQLHPSDQPRAFAVATDPQALAEIQLSGAHVLGEGQITGLNGVLLAAGAARGISGVCLLGELPFFAAGVPNPAAARAVLEHFVELAGIEIDFSELQKQAETVERQLMQMLERMQAAADLVEQEEENGAHPEPQAEPRTTAQAKLDPKAKRRIEQLFEHAQQDRSKAVELKQELDRLKVFKQYEDRFLDLFRQAG